MLTETAKDHFIVPQQKSQLIGTHRSGIVRSLKLINVMPSH